MTRVSRTGPLGLLARHGRVGLATSIVIASLFALVALLLALAPRGFAVLATEEMRHHLEELPATRADLSAEGSAEGTLDFSAPTVGGIFADLDAAVGRLDDQPEPLARIAAEPEWYLSTPVRGTGPTQTTPQPQPAEIDLAVDPGWEGRVEFVDGGAPDAWTGDDLDGRLPSTRAPIEVALSEDAAHEMKVGVGDLLDYDPAPLRVAGIYRPLDAADGFWEQAYLLGTSYVNETPNGPATVFATAYVATESAAGLAGTLRFGVVSAWLPLDGAALQIADAPLVAQQVEQANGAGLALPNGKLLPVRSQLGDEITLASARIDVLAAVLGLAGSGVFGVVLAVFALGVRSVIQRRTTALALAAARGASGLRLRAVMALEGVVLALPGTIAALALAAILVPVSVGPEAVALPLVAGLAVPVLFAAQTSPRALRAARVDLSSRSGSRVRWVAELALVGLAVLSVSLLAARGLAESSGSVGLDPLLIAAPLLLVGAAAVITLRLYPLPVLALHRALRAHRGAIGVLGAARAAREPVLGFVAALALLGAVSVAVFSAAMSTTVTAGVSQAARESIGAEVRIDAPALDDGIRADITGLPGVTAATPLDIHARRDLTIGEERADVTLVFADADDLEAIRPDVPRGIGGEDADSIPVVFSADLAELLTEPGAAATIDGVPVTVLGTARIAGFVGVEGSWVLVDRSHLDDFGIRDQVPDTMLLDVAPGVDTAATAEAAVVIVLEATGAERADNVAAFDLDTELAVARRSPLIGGLDSALRLALILAIGLAAVTIVLASVAASGRRAATVGILRTLGVSRREIAGLTAWEIAPVALTAAIAGGAVGLALTWLVTAAVDLRPFLGGTDAPGPIVDPAAVLATEAVILAVAAVAAIIATLVARTRHPAETLKMGAE